MEQIQINSDELNFHSLSFNDENGRLFQWQGNIYRAIPTQQASLYQNLLQQGIISNLVSKKLLIETELTSLQVENYAIVIKHRRIDFFSYPQEWCGEMLKDAALLHLDLCLELERYDLITGDAHPLNILFDGCQPIFIDLGSIEKITPEKHHLWSAYNQFCRCFVNPLRLMAQGQGRIARWLMHDYEQGVLSEDVIALTDKSPLNLLKNNSRNWLKATLLNYLPSLGLLWAKQIRDYASRLRSIFSNDSKQLPSRHSFYQQIRQELAEINLPSLPRPEPNFDHLLLKSSFVSDNSQIQEIVISLVSNLQPSSVLVMGNNDNDGTYAQLIAQNTQVVFLSPNEEKVTQVYLNNKTNQLPILPLFINFASPSCDLSNDWFTPASDRLNCELVLALDLIDWLVFQQYLPFDRIVERLAIFAQRWLLVEFVTVKPFDLDSLSPDFKLIFSWYNLDNFIQALSKKFAQVKIIHQGSENNVLLLCLNEN
jgi:hypothetical protein